MPNDHLRAARDARGWTREEAAKRGTKVARELGYGLRITADQLTQYELYGVRPQEARIGVFCKLYRMRPGDLGFENERDPVGRYDAEPEGATNRRDAVKGMAGLLMAPPAMLADPAIASLRRLAEMSLGRATDGAEAVVMRIGYDYSAEPPQRLLPRLSELAAFSEALASLATDAYRGRLISVAGISHGLLANALFESGDHAAAEATILLALAYGEEIGDGRLIAYVRDRQSTMVGERGDYVGALQLIEAGLAAAPMSTPIRLRLLWKRASMNARLQRRSQALGDVERIHAEYSRLQQDELSESPLSVSPIVPDYAAGEILTRLGDAPAAEPFQARTIAHYEGLAGGQARPTTLAYVRLHAATNFVRAGEPEHALEVGRKVLDCQRPTSILSQRLRSFGAALMERQSALPAARDFQEQLSLIPA